jgi:hypothetical protein
LKKHHLRRKPIFIIGLFFKFLSLGLTLVASMAFSTDRDILTHTSFARGIATIPKLSSFMPIDLNIGFRAIDIDDPNYVLAGDDDDDQVATFNKFCDGGVSGDVTRELLVPSLCGRCRDSSQAFVLSCVFNLIVIVRKNVSTI